MSDILRLLGLGVISTQEAVAQLQQQNSWCQSNSLYAGMSQKEINVYASASQSRMQLDSLLQQNMPRPKTDYDLALDYLDSLYPSSISIGERYREPLWLRFLRWLAKIL